MFLNLRDLIFVVIEDILRVAGSALETSEFVVRLCLFFSIFGMLRIWLDIQVVNVFVYCEIYLFVVDFHLVTGLLGYHSPQRDIFYIL